MRKIKQETNETLEQNTGLNLGEHVCVVIAGVDFDGFNNGLMLKLTNGKLSARNVASA